MSTLKISRLVAAILLFVALIHLPIGFYTFLRIMVTGIAAYNAYEARNDTPKVWFIFFIVAAIVYNPLIPIYLGSKSSWMPVDIVFGIIFFMAVFKKQQ